MFECAEVHIYKNKKLFPGHDLASGQKRIRVLNDDFIVPTAARLEKGEDVDSKVLNYIELPALGLAQWVICLTYILMLNG